MSVDSAVTGNGFDLGVRINPGHNHINVLALRTGGRSVVPLVDDCEDNETTDLVLARSRTYDGDQSDISRTRMYSTIDTIRHQAHTHTKTSTECSPKKRRFSFQLPSFKTLGISSCGSDLPRRHPEPTLFPASDNMFMQTQSIFSNKFPAYLCSGLPLLTPPPEDMADSVLDHHTSTALSDSNIDTMSPADQSDHGPCQSLEAPNARVSGIILPDSTNTATPSQLRKSPWMMKACHKLLNSLNSIVSSDSIQVVSQTLPSQAKDSRSRPTFEEILESLQTDMDMSPYITVTHAVPQARVMEELPKTPPSTPSSRHETNDYFGNDQTIFTHAAVVPIYHDHEHTDPNALAGRSVHHIAAPSSVQVSILERYIPPTMPQEIDDFFSLSTRSYLADRLSELSTNNGSLLLMYPTRAGGKTFTHQYLGPIIDPHLRRFIMLNGLTSDAATRMGKMTAADHMLNFEEMQSRIVSLCQNLTARPTVRGPRSAFNITHSETTSISLDRSTWMNWYVEQEQSRLKQNLVEYHQAGGRMPQAESFREVTVSMLTRDFIEGLQKSQEPASDADIEVGIFLITRSML